MMLEGVSILTFLVIIGLFAWQARERGQEADRLREEIRHRDWGQLSPKEKAQIKRAIEEADKRWNASSMEGVLYWELDNWGELTPTRQAEIRDMAKSQPQTFYNKYTDIAVKVRGCTPEEGEKMFEVAKRCLEVQS